MERRGSPETFFFFKSTPSRQVLYFTCASQFIVTLRSVCPHLTSEPDQEVKCHWGSPSFRESLGLWLHADPPPTHTHTLHPAAQRRLRGWVRVHSTQEPFTRWSPLWTVPL